MDLGKMIFVGACFLVVWILSVFRILILALFMTIKTMRKEKQERKGE